MNDDKLTKDPGDILLKQYLQGSCTQAEQEQIERWLEEDPSHAERLEQFAARNTNVISIEEKRIKAEVLWHIDDGKERVVEADKAHTLRTIGRSANNIGVKWAAAAVILLVFATSLSVYLLQNEPSVQEEDIYVERTVPAGNRATLTLSDGSQIYLNAGSTVKFPEEFGPDSRKVYLDGEAFFEVTGDADRPFEVHAGDLKTTVLGTAFNVKAYSEERRAQVAVEDGKVSVVREYSTQTSMLLSPNQWATFDKNKDKLRKESGDIRNIIAWKDGILFFHDKTVAEAANMLERWYDTDIIIENEAINDCVLHGEHKEESLENVLKAMQFALDLDYTFTEKGVRITGGRCK